MGIMDELVKDIFNLITSQKDEFVNERGKDVCHYCGGEATTTWTYRGISCAVCDQCYRNLNSDY